MGKCTDSHQQLPVVLGKGRTVYLTGGNCRHRPEPDDYDVVVGLDLIMDMGPRSLPWNEGEQILYLMGDGRAPKNPKEFDKMIDWLIAQLHEGKKVFVGCIGGHGRTGVVFSAIVAKTMKLSDPITYVRENYCKRVVESSTQVDFLVEHYGAKKVESSKGYISHDANAYSLWPGYIGNTDETQPLGLTGSSSGPAKVKPVKGSRLSIHTV